MLSWDMFTSSKGRINRKSWWVAQIVIYLVTSGVSFLLSGGQPERTPNVLVALLGLIVFALGFGASVTVTIKRLHDIDKSGWYVLLGLIPLLGQLALLILAGFVPGTQGTNRYGEMPT